MDLDSLIDPFEPTSTLMDQTGLQESGSFRSLKTAQRIAEYLINEEGVMGLSFYPP